MRARGGDDAEGIAGRRGFRDRVEHLGAAFLRHAPGAFRRNIMDASQLNQACCSQFSVDPGMFLAQRARTEDRHSDR